MSSQTCFTIQVSLFLFDLKCIRIFLAISRWLKLCVLLGILMQEKFVYYEAIFVSLHYLQQNVYGCCPSAVLTLILFITCFQLIFYFN